MDYKKVLQFITHDPIRKIFAIICAFALWIFVAVGHNYQYTKDIQIVYTNLSEDKILVDSVSSISIVFSGRGASLLNIWAAAPKARCDLSKTKLGENRIPAENIIVPTGFSDVSFSHYKTSQINVTIDKKIKKDIKVAVPIKGSPKDGFSIDEITALDTITVIGPRKMLRNLREIMTESLSVGNRNAPFTKDVRLRNPSPLIHVSKEIVSVEIEVDTTVERLFVNIPLILIYSPSQRVYSEKITLDTLIVEGAKSRIANLRKRDIEVRIPLTELPVGEHYLPAEVILPDYFKPVYSNPQKFKIQLY